jgi:hypothetical protein
MELKVIRRIQNGKQTDMLVEFTWRKWIVGPECSKKQWVSCTTHGSQWYHMTKSDPSWRFRLARYFQPLSFLRDSNNPDVPKMEIINEH